jgi:hypothetical protein
MNVQLKKTMKAVVAAMVVVAFTSCNGKNSGLNVNIEGVDGPHVEFVNGLVLLSMVFKTISIDGGATIPIPKYPNSSIQVGPDFQSSGTLLVLTIAAQDFLKDKGKLFDPQTLPGGRPLPAVATGVMPAIAVQIPVLLNSVLYFGPEVLGVFVPFTKLNIAGSILSFRFHNKEGQPIGILSLVGSDKNGENAGILAMMRADLLGIFKKPSASKMAQLAQLF